MAKVTFAPQFTALLNGELTQAGLGSNLFEVLVNICRAHEALRSHIFINSEQISPFIAFTISGINEVYTSQWAKKIKLVEDDQVQIILPIAGG